MAGRYDNWRHKRSTGDVAPTVESAAKKLLGELKDQVQLGGITSGKRRIVLDDGTVVTAELIDGMPRTTVVGPPNPGGKLEEVIYLYASSTTKGLCIFDLGTKKLVKNLTGLEQYTLQAVSDDGKIAWMLYGIGVTNGQAFAARVDVGAVSAFASSLQVNSQDAGSAVVPGFGINSDDAALSPNAQRLLVHVRGSMDSGGVVREGVGAVLLLNPETLAQVRSPLRMTFLPAPMAWRGDSERFYLGTSLADDVGDNPTDARLQDLTESVDDYVSVFDQDGVLVGSRHLKTWTGGTPDSGWARTVKGLVASRTRLYASVDGDVLLPGGSPTLYILDATDDTLPILASYDLTPYLDGGIAPSVLCLSRDGTMLRMATDGKMLQFSVEGDAVSSEYGTAKAEYATFAPSRDPSFDVLQLGPKSRIGQPPDNRQFFMSYDDGVRVLRAYRNFATDDLPVYEFDMLVHGTDYHYRLANVGTREAA